MRELRYVSPAEEPEDLVVETADGEQFRLRIDPGLRDAVTPAPQPSGEDDAGGSLPSPREIQTRVRAGADPQQLAEEHQVGLDKIMRFAGPVLEERARIADEARRARARRNTPEGQTVVFGEAVDERFGAYGIDAATVRWGARRRSDGQWVITATWPGEDREHKADWVFQLSTRHVSPADDTADDLLSTKAIRPMVPTPSAPVPVLAPGVFTFPAMPDAHTGPMPRMERVFDQEAGQPALGPDAPRLAPLGASGSILVEPYEEPLPLGPDDPLAGVPDGAARAPRLVPPGERHGTRHRTKVPAWDDIMLGVRRKQD